MNRFKFATAFIVLTFFVIGCSNNAAEETSSTDSTSSAAAPAQPVAAKPDMAKIKTEIQALESAWANADNARDTNAIAAFYADDAVSFSNNRPMLVGKAAIEADIKIYLAKRPKGSTIAFDVLDVFGDENTVTEVGKTTGKDAEGKVTYNGKYMAIWEKRSGKYLCVRDIGNDDVKAK